MSIERSPEAPATHLAVEDFGTADVPAVLALNTAAVPAVNALDEAALLTLAAMGRLRVARTDRVPVAGALLTLLPGRPYDSLNYRWFEARFERFLYVDRVVVSPRARGQGIGRALYEDALRRAEEDALCRICAEVNVDPPNPTSMAFHAALGFRVLTERHNEAHGKRVAMLERPLSPE
ncbi:GNAT family N-acetyltransferase [Acuticoccus sp.]|uniref:GNAT family N-acetyltransferase n=1 Tax=Acuticoccus sp. TaxID=1904378 RepID=UPI003B522A5D